MAAAVPKSPWSTRYCCVVGCPNTQANTKGREPPVKFYRFPGKWYEKERRQAWTTAVRRVNPDGSAWKPTAATRICSVHFAGNRRSDVSTHASYYPTIFPSAYKKKPADEARSQRWLARFMRKASFGRCDTESTVVHGIAEAAKEPPPDNDGDLGLAGQQRMGEDAVRVDMDPGCPVACFGDVAAQTSPKETAEQGTQTDTAQPGKLVILLSMATGRNASTQVSHVEQDGEGVDFVRVRPLGAGCTKSRVPSTKTARS
ncbi:uncharacterized protein LOC144138162 isoform X2 [Haemaphysalis longicornis]